MNFWCTVLHRILNILIFTNRVISVICIRQSLWSFIKRQTSGTSSDNEWQRVTTSGTTSDNEWYNEWQRMTTSGTTSDNEWQRVTTSGTTSDNEWQRMTKSDSEWYNEWQQVTTNGNEWEQVTAVVQQMKTAQYTSKNEWLPSFQWQKQIHYYFKGWMATIRVVR